MYDNANRRGTVTFANGIVLTYGYDNDSRPVSINYKLGTTEVAGITYQYDAVGRRTQFGGNIAATISLRRWAQRHTTSPTN